METSRRGRRLRRIAAIIASILAVGVVAAAIYLHGLGYPHGPVYRLIAAQTRAPEARRDVVAVFVSGDMGFNTGMGPKIAAELAEQGIPVLGVNSLSAFAQRKTPAESALFVRTAVARALALPGARRVVLIGQSFGANILLAGLVDLPRPLRARVPLVELIVPGETTAFQATPGGVLSLASDGPALPGARKLDWVPVLCIHGQTESRSLCPLWSQPNVRRVTLPGDHFLREDTRLVAATLMRDITAATATPKPAQPYEKFR